MNPKVIIIVDPFSTGNMYAPCFNTLGFTCYAVLSQKQLPSFYLDSFCPDDFKEPILYTPEQITDKFAPDEVLAVVTGAETGVVVSDQLSDYFSVQGNDPKTSENRRNKYLMQQALKDSHLSYIKSTLINQHVAIASLFDSATGYVLKPINSAGSDGVQFYDDKPSLINALNTLTFGTINSTGATNDQYLLQERHTGDEFVVDMVVQNGSVYICSLCLYKKGEHNNSATVYETMTMLDPTAPWCQPIIDYAKKAALALGITFGAVHMELFASPINNYTTPVMIEAGARLHGGIAPFAFKACYTPDLLSASVMAYLKKPLKQLFQDSKTTLIKNARVVFLINYRQNALLDTTNFSKQISQLTSYVNHKVSPEHTPLPLTKDLLTCPALVCLVATQQTTLDTDEQHLRQIFEACLA